MINFRFFLYSLVVILILSLITALSLVKDSDNNLYKEQNEKTKIDKFSAVAISDKKNYIATGNDSGQVFIWDIQSNSIQLFQPLHSKIRRIFFTKKNRLLLTSNWEAILLDIKGNIISKFKGVNSEVESIQISETEDRVLISDGVKATIYDLKGNNLQEFHSTKSNNVFALFCDSHPASIYIITKDAIQEFNKLGKLEQSWDISFVEDEIRSVEQNPSTGLLLINTFKDIYILDKDKKLINKIHSSERRDNSLGKFTASKLSSDGKLLFTSSTDNSVIIWSINGNQIDTMKGHTNNITSFSITEDSNFLLTSSDDSSLILWNLKSNESLIFRNITKGSVVYNSKGDFQKILNEGERYKSHLTNEISAEFLKNEKSNLLKEFLF